MAFLVVLLGLLTLVFGILWIVGTWSGAIAAWIALTICFAFVGAAAPNLHQEDPITFPIEVVVALAIALLPKAIIRVRSVRRLPRNLVLQGQDASARDAWGSPQ